MGAVSYDSSVAMEATKWGAAEVKSRARLASSAPFAARERIVSRV
jgi:hypothetical protein